MKFVPAPVLLRPVSQGSVTPKGEVLARGCADIAELFSQWHFRFAKRSLAAGDDENDEQNEADTQPCVKDAKTKMPFRWIPIHPAA